MEMSDFADSPWGNLTLSEEWMGLWGVGWSGRRTRIRNGDSYVR